MKFKLEKKYTKNEDRFAYKDTNGKVLAQVDFSTDPKTKKLTIDHTIVDDSLKGKGVAPQLMATMVNYAKKTGNKLSLVCPYAKKYFEQNQKQYSDVLK